MGLSKMQQWGKDGMIVVMMSLVWWGNASSTDAEWLETVRDIINVLHCMQTPPTIGPSAALPRMNRKHKSQEMEGPSGAGVGHKRLPHEIQ